MTANRHDTASTDALRRLQDTYEEALVASFRSAEQRMGLADVNDEDDAELDAIYEERFHCEVCIVRNVLEEVFPVVIAYTRTLEHALGLATIEEVILAALEAPQLHVEQLPWIADPPERHSIWARLRSHLRQR